MARHQQPGAYQQWGLGCCCPARPESTTKLSTTTGDFDGLLHGFYIYILGVLPDTATHTDSCQRYPSKEQLHPACLLPDMGKAAWGLSELW